MFRIEAPSRLSLLRKNTLMICEVGLDDLRERDRQRERSVPYGIARYIYLFRLGSHLPVLLVLVMMRKRIHARSCHPCRLSKVIPW